MIAGPLRENIRQTIGDERFARAHFLQRASFDRLVHDFDSGPVRDLRALWRLHTPALWSQVFSVFF